MATFRVLIVEDEFLAALDLEQALTAAGCDICGVAASASHALALAKATRPEFAVVDVHLAPGDGRAVARELIALYRTGVLFATAYFGEVGELAQTGAHGYLSKPYDPHDVHLSLVAISEMCAGRIPNSLPGRMVALQA